MASFTLIEFRNKSLPQFDSVQQRQVTWTIRVMDSRAQNHIAFAPLTCFSGANGTKQAVFMPLNHGTGRREDSPWAELPGPARRSLRLAYSPCAVPSRKHPTRCVRQICLRTTLEGISQSHRVFYVPRCCRLSCTQST